jgi:BolA family transcriptional regulator, general stress-responsive regulator
MTDSVAATIRAKLIVALSPELLELRDDSAQHRGHAGHDGRGESHFYLTIRSAAFQGKSRVARHQMVHSILAEELAGQIHALSLKLLASDE